MAEAKVMFGEKDEGYNTLVFYKAKPGYLEKKPHLKHIPEGVILMRGVMNPQIEPAIEIIFRDRNMAGAHTANGKNWDDPEAEWVDSLFFDTIEEVSELLDFRVGFTKMYEVK